MLRWLVSGFLLFQCICFSIKIHVRPSSDYYASTSFNLNEEERQISDTSAILNTPYHIHFCEQFTDFGWHFNENPIFFSQLKAALLACDADFYLVFYTQFYLFHLAIQNGICRFQFSLETYSATVFNTKLALQTTKCTYDSNPSNYRRQ